ncbi:prolyl 4-hydroxylase subunit alpha-2-like [Penaeus japonicus]|uniref:prolyl 4-hydroxylase subunit alpha-2-like n=1 Tax=Penaeus japonicus TaxID=27405 RepID=UPI001C70CD5F|nr:prolyl 4-hydroxylase subunit alpha-2-like [Penaeus japonicus]
MTGNTAMLLPAVMVLLLQCSTAVAKSPVSGELHSFPHHLKDVFLFDKHLAEVLRHIIPPTVESERYLESYAGTMLDAMRVGGDVLNEAILGNPLQVYALIKRLVLYWPRLKDIVYNTTQAREECHDKIKPCEEWILQRGCDALYMDQLCPFTCGFCQVNENNAALKALENITVLPSIADLNGAAQSLALLQRVYLLPMQHLLHGKILNTISSVRLTTWDILRVARASADAERWVNAWVWYNESLSSITDPEALAHVADLLAFVEQQHDEHWRDDIKWTREANQFPFLLADVPQQKPEGCVYTDICRGDLPRRKKEIPPEGPQCHLSSRGSPFLALQPVKMEYLSHNPVIIVFPDFLSDEEAEIIINVSRDRMTKDLAGGGRQSHQTFLNNRTHPLFPRLSRRVEAATGLLAHEGLTWEEVAGDPIKVRYYGTGGHLNPHVDVFTRHLNASCDDHEACSGVGDRIATFMFYLNDVKAGGRTAFYSSKVAVTPKKGTGVFWYNLKRNGEYDRRMDHGGCPVLLGSKWVAVKWIRENLNFLRRPCSTDPDE